jgi:hypothetical protein
MQIDAPAASPLKRRIPAGASRRHSQPRRSFLDSKMKRPERDAKSCIALGIRN